MIFKEAPPLIKVECNTNAGDPKFEGPTGSRFYVMCPKDCSKKEIVLYGDGIFTDDSNIC